MPSCVASQSAALSTPQISLQNCLMEVHVSCRFKDYKTVADPDQAFGGRQEFLHLNTKGCLRQSLCVTQKRLPFVGQRVAIFVGPTMRFFRE